MFKPGDRVVVIASNYSGTIDRLNPFNSSIVYLKNTSHFFLSKDLVLADVYNTPLYKALKEENDH